MKVLAALIAVTALLSAQNAVDIKPSPQQVAWQDLEIGVLIHFGPNTFMDREWGEGTADPSVFNPTQLDAEQWVLASKAAGAKYLIMVAKHHDGFCLWPSRHTDYSVKSSPWREGKGDLVGEVAAACRKHGLKFGTYLSPWDRHEPAYADNEAYDDYYVKQVQELARRYGELTEFWLDGAGSEGHVYNFERYAEVLRTYQPNTLFFADVGFLPWGDIRWVGNEDGHALETNWNVIDRHGYLRWRPVEADTPLRHRNWFWHPNAEDRLKSLDQLMEIYHKSVGRGAQLVLGLAPDDRGLIPEVDVARLKEFGARINLLYGNSLLKPGLTATEFPEPMWFDRTVAMESLVDGQRIMKYQINAKVDGEWKTVHTGTTIGHKKIDIFPRVRASGVHLKILQSAGKPAIREFQVFDGGAPR